MRGAPVNDAQNQTKRVAVVGGGITGLAAAHRLHELEPTWEIALFESADHLGGVMQTENCDGFCIERGPDSMITQMPWGLDLCRRIGFEDELIGFIKLLRTGSVADLVLIVCKEEHRDKRPTNALIAKAVEVCEEHGIEYLTYAQFYYFKKNSSSLAEFKRRNGFEPILFPRYYVPLTMKGRLAIALNLQHGIRGILPERLLDFIRNMNAERVLVLSGDHAYSMDFEPLVAAHREHEADALQ